MFSSTVPAVHWKEKTLPVCVSSCRATATLSGRVGTLTLEFSNLNANISKNIYGLLGRKAYPASQLGSPKRWTEIKFLLYLGWAMNHPRGMFSEANLFTCTGTPEAKMILVQRGGILIPRLRGSSWHSQRNKAERERKSAILAAMQTAPSGCSALWTVSNKLYKIKNCYQSHAFFSSCQKEP